MHVLTGRGGELAAPFPPLCDNPDCACSRTLAALDSAYPLDAAVVADSDITPDALTQRCAELLHRTGWAESLGPDDTAEIAHEMAADAAQAAAQFPVGTRLRAQFDHHAEAWVYAPR
ncbi:MAG: hypothetical protein ACM4D3_18310 [Candidatus Sericytochromatia bacterium]